MTAVGCSQAVGSGFESLPCQNFLRFIPNFSIPEISEKLRDSPTKNFGTVRQKKFRRKIVILPPPIIHKLFRNPKLVKH